MKVPSIFIILCLVSCGVIAVFGFDSVTNDATQTAFDFVTSGVSLLLKNVYDRLFSKQLLTAGFWIVLSTTLLLQVVLPAVRDQKLFSRGLMQDLVWFVYEPFFSVFVYGTYILWAKDFYSRHLSILTVNCLKLLPEWPRFFLAVLLLDFLNWFQHVLHHKIRFLWNLHSIHHSQIELNFFSAYRFHVLEFAVRNTIMVFPFFIFDLSPPVIVSFAFFEKWYAQFCHGNIRSNLGPLKYIFVTPQSHRVHHSREVAHFDTNFGALFSIWDRLFGTVHKQYEIYPQTGIQDRSFPKEDSMSLGTLLLIPFRQIFYGINKSFKKSPPLTARAVAVSRKETV